jgi:hypothetical protein
MQPVTQKPGSLDSGAAAESRGFLAAVGLLESASEPLPAGTAKASTSVVLPAGAHLRIPAASNRSAERVARDSEEEADVGA